MTCCAHDGVVGESTNQEDADSRARKQCQWETAEHHEIVWEQVLEVFIVEVYHPVDRARRGARVFESYHRFVYEESQHNTRYQKLRLLFKRIWN
jgi:hypothetical protein